jgi:hypothetical protein
VRVGLEQSRSGSCSGHRRVTPMHLLGGSGAAQRACAVVSASVLLVGLVGCSSGSSETSATTSAPASTGAAEAGATTDAPASTTDAAPATTTTLRIDDASDGPRSAPPQGSGTALLGAVRVAPHPGFERIVFEFTGTARPGYRIRWVDGPILADGSGEPVEVAGEANLEMVFEPASGVDMTDGKPTYTGPDRIPVAQQTRLVTDLVRTGDFENVLTWVAGTMRRAPFRVLSLTDPARLAIDISTGPASSPNG